MFRSLISLMIVLDSIMLLATHQRAAELTFRHITGYTYEFTLITYTYTPSLADRPSLDVNWGDGTSSTLPRIEKTQVPNAVNITRNVYKGIHTFPAPATYTVTMEDPNRNAGVINIPYSVNVPMFISTTIVVNPLLGPNNSPILTFPPIDEGCVGQPFYHNPGAYDPDGDSIAYRLIPCRGEGGMNIIGYTYPAATNTFSINPVTGTLTWDSPIIQGEYNVAILIEEYRNGILISAITRDMQINILSCNNKPPIITAINDTCVNAGTNLSFPVTAVDPNNDKMLLSSSGDPFLASINPASFPSVVGYSPLTSVFNWQTHCLHVRKNPWIAYFRAEDDNGEVKLIDIHTTFITIVAPAPENLTATAQGNAMLLQWNKHQCSNVRGYHIYRRIGPSGFVPDHCQVGVPAYTGYTYIGSTNSINDTTYLDNNNGNGLFHGPEYCYLVTAFFADGAESYASNEACASLIKDVPVITHVSIIHTDSINGQVHVQWSKPTLFDSIFYPGPYRYSVYRASGFTALNHTLVQQLNSINDTIFIDSLLNTVLFPWNYYIQLYDLSQPTPRLIGSTTTASSIYLTIEPFDQALVLKWDEKVPWLNYNYVIYQWNPVTQTFDSITTTNNREFLHTGLENHKEYCYLIKGKGAYFTPGFNEPFINFSQVQCGIPEDFIAPCPPELIVEPKCTIPSNLLQWTNPILTCPYSGDTRLYHVFYSSTIDGVFKNLITINNPYQVSYEHLLQNTVAGCYYIIAVDSVGNASAPSDTVCVDIDSCNLYRLPNVFTPNGDGFNDFWKPFPYDFVERIQLQVFNRWGSVVFETSNPDINWDGTHYKNHQELAEGTYFYICEVYEHRLIGITKRLLTGSVTILRTPKYLE